MIMALVPKRPTWLPALAAILILAGFDITDTAGQTCGNQLATVIGTDDIDLIVGTSGDDVIWAGDGNDVIFGRGGNDVLCGAGGDDWIEGGNGDDRVLGGPGFDTLKGQSGNDQLSGQGEDDLVDGGTGSDSLTGDSGNDELNGGLGPDLLIGGPGRDLLRGHSGDDILEGSDAADQLFGGMGDDVLDGGGGRDVMMGEMGDDELDGGDGLDQLIGGPGRDLLIGGEGSDEIHGNSGRDTLIGGGPEDLLFGGEEADYLRSGMTCDGGNGADVIEDCRQVIDGARGDGPQIILFAMLDDADYNDFGLNSSDAITPNIDTMATAGVQLTDYYSASGICSPTRLSVMTGDNPTRHGLTRLWPDIGAVPTTSQTRVGRKGLDDDRLLLTDLALAGYRTAHFGKWHLGNSRSEHGPAALGYDEFRLVGPDPSNSQGEVLHTATISEADWNSRSFSWAVSTESGDELVDGAWRPEYLADEIIAYVDSLQPGERAFINWWAIAPHKPIRTPPGFDNTGFGFDLSTERGQLLAMMADWDAQLGRVLDHLDATGLSQDALVMVTSDNGGVRTALSPDRLITGSKSTLGEGGIRVPFVAKWPGMIPPGTKSAEPMVSTDLLPTLFARVGLPIGPTDGVDAMDALLGRVVARPHGMFWNMRTGVTRLADVASGDQDEWAYREGCFKLLKEGGESVPQLYNLCDDPSESVDLADVHPSTYAAMLEVARAERVRLSTIEIVPTSTDESMLIPFDERFNISAQDFTLTFDLDIDLVEARPAELFDTNGISISVDPRRLELTLDVTGMPTSRATTTNQLVTRRLTGSIRPSSTISLVVTGFVSGYSTVDLLIDGVAVGSVEGEDSLFALQSGREPLHIGALGYEMSAITASTLALD